MLFEGTLPFWLDRLTIALIWSLFAWAYKYLDGLEGIVAVQTVTPLCGMVILAFLGAIPILTGCFSAVFALIITAYAVYNWYPAQLRLTTSGCQALGFLTAWLFMLAAREGSASCALIFSLYYIVEVIWAGLKKLSRKPQYQEIVPNTFYYQTNLSGLSPDIISENIFKLDALLVIFGCFQIYAPNSYSLAILGVILTFWFLNHLRNWQVAERSLGEINREVVKDLKENVEDIKKTLIRTSEPHDCFASFKKLFRPKPERLPERLAACSAVKFKVVVVDFLDNIESSGGENLARLLSTQEGLSLSFFDENFPKSFLNLESRTLFDLIDRGQTIIEKPALTSSFGDTATTTASASISKPKGNMKTKTTPTSPCLTAFSFRPVF